MISGDGTNIGKKLYVINITFNMLNEGGNAMSADRNHLIAVIRDSETMRNWHNPWQIYGKM